jgi:hypothetical protein
VRSTLERDILKQILDYLAAKQIFAFRLGTGTIVLPYGEKMRAFKGHNLGSGAADIIVPPAGTVWVECKSERGQQSRAQKEFEEMVERLGHKYILAHSIDDLEGML